MEKELAQEIHELTTCRVRGLVKTKAGWRWERFKGDDEADYYEPGQTYKSPAAAVGALLKAVNFIRVPGDCTSA